MQTQITARHFHASDNLKAYASERVNKLERYYDGITNAHVILSNGSGSPDGKHAEITLSVFQKQLTADDHAASYEQAIDRCVAHLKRQILKYKEKLKDKHKDVHR